MGLLWDFNTLICLVGGVVEAAKVQICTLGADMAKAKAAETH